MMKLNKFAQAVHENAVKHGWWDEERTFGEIIALCHSELSEALEEYRAKRPMLYYPCNAGGVCVDDAEGDNVSCGSRVTDPEHQEAACKARSKKPEGVAVELADCIIRVLDYFGKEELDVDALMQEAMKAVMCDVPGRIYAATLGDCISRWHLLLSLAYACWCKASGTHASALRMARCVCEILAWGKVTDGVDFEMILDIKHEYNKTRPYWNSFWSGNLEASYNPLAYMPYFKDLVSIAQGYDVTRMDMEAIEKVWSAFTNMRSALSGEGRYSIAGASANMLAEVARLFGLPVANIKRDVQAVATTAAIETDNYLMQYRMDKALLNIGYQGNRSGFMDILYAASVNDPEAYEIIYEDMVASGITEDQIRTAMESRMKEDQGVESVDELSRRYLTPNQERTYDRLYGQVSSSPVWRAASPEQREAVEEDIYDLTTGTDAGVKLQEKIDGGAAYGITEADYLLYLAAREIADGENEDPEKRNGSIDQAEAQAAIDMLTGLSDEGRAYLWQSTNKGWSEEKNPYR